MNGWSLWDSYFRRAYGPDYESKRQARTGECACCSGRATTPESERRRRLIDPKDIAEHGTCYVPPTRGRHVHPR